ncbi:hypothetical protein BJX62DRAFT_101762 [Aspergillus germanicus]
MAETSIPYDVSGWGFDPMNPGPGFNLEPGLSGDEELWYRSQLGMNAFDQGHLQPEETLAGYDFATPSSGKTAYQLPTHPMEGFHSRADKLLPRFGNMQTPDHSTPYSLDDLLRTASQLATERALYMNIPPAVPQSPPAYHHSPAPAADAYISSPGASPSHHSNASDTDEPAPAFDFAQVYRLPEGNGNGNSGGSNTNAHFFPPPIHTQSHDHAPAAGTVVGVPHSASMSESKAHAEGNLGKSKKNNLTPLEMPDGSTRFTANWLPVDPQGGFTIRPPVQHMHFMDLDPMMEFDTHFDHGHGHGRGNYNYRDAFISIENHGGAEAGAGAGAGV